MTFLLFFSFLVGLPVHAATPGIASAMNPASTARHIFTWYDGNRQRSFHLATDEIAFYSYHPVSIGQWTQLLSETLPDVPGTEIVKANEVLARIKIVPSLNRSVIEDLLHRDGSSGMIITPVFYSSSLANRNAYILLPEMIVHFSSPTTKDRARQWGIENGLPLIRSLSLDNAYLFSCRSLKCLEKSQQIHDLDARVRYAYPNWIRPRQTRQISFGSKSDLSLSKTAQPDPVTVGETLEYRIVIRNLGPAPANAVQMTDSLPETARFESILTSKGFCFGTTRIQCNIGTMKAGESANITLRVIPSSSGNLTNSARVSSFGIDPDPSNNAASVTTSVSSGGGGGPASWNDPFYPDQWHLENTGQGGGSPGADVNVVPVWSDGLTGKGLQIAIVDDGLEIKHEDLAANTNHAYHHDWIGNDNDPTAGSHGTSVAGVAAADGNNDVGVVGAAPDAELIGLRLLGANSDTNEAAALDYLPAIVDLSSNSWGPADTGEQLAGPGPLAEAAIADGATNGRGGKGIIYCWAGGNGGDNDNSNYDGYANLRYTIAVAASTNQGTRAFYSEKGANILVNTPSSGGTLAITTTDRTGFAGYDFGNYTTQFGGTSASSPLACGLIALLLEANPNLGWRDVQWILASTAFRNDPQDSDWMVNGAGYHINHKYGFGRIDIAAALESARNWTPLGGEINATGEAAPMTRIPDNDPLGVDSSISITQDLRVESVEVIFSADDHPRWGDLDVRLTAPSGTVSRLAEPHESGMDTARYSHWRFTSMRHLGESSQGTWTLTVKDLASGNTGTFQSWKLILHGSKANPPPPPPEAAADLSMTLRDDPDPAKLGQYLRYTVTVANTGPDPATGVTARVSLPTQWEVTGIVTEQGRCTRNSTVRCDLGSLAANEQTQVTIEVLPSSEGNFTIEGTSDADQTDPDPDNNHATETTTVIGNQTTYPLTVRVVGSGSVTSDPPGIHCPDDCREDYPETTVVTLTAQPSQGRRVLWFGGGCSGTQSTCKIEMTQAVDITAWFY